MKNILLTGGAGYIGTHAAVELLNAGYGVTIFDNFSNSLPLALERVKKIVSKNFQIISGDIRDEKKLIELFNQNDYYGVIHFAGLKAVGESARLPLDYYSNNVVGTLCLLKAMRQVGLKNFVFSSSATVYGDPLFLPLTEAHPLRPVNVYGRTKLFIEDILRDLYLAEPDWRISILRYFNPVGAHKSGLIGEDPLGQPNNLMPFIAQVAVGRRDKLMIWGNDYPTPDGTGVRDYIHVVDLALGHIRALEIMLAPQCIEINLGTGCGYSVLEVVSAFERASGRKIDYEFAPRRDGDTAICYADVTLANQLLKWKSLSNLDEMCSDVWRWQLKNPHGYS